MLSHVGLRILSKVKGVCIIGGEQLIGAIESKKGGRLSLSVWES